jgi:proline iminopeptidase
VFTEKISGAGVFMDKIKEGYIDISGWKLWYSIAGADKEGIPLLCLHGGPGAPHDYLKPLEKLSDERPVIFYDQIGCGNSDKPNDLSYFTVENYIDELETVREALNLSEVHIMGQSWGSTLAASYYLDRKPAGVISLTFSGPVMSMKMFEKDARRLLEEMPDDLKKIIYDCEKSGNFLDPAYEKAMEVFYSRHVYRMKPWPDAMNKTIEKLGHEVYKYMQGPSEFTVTGTLKGLDLTDRLSELDLPVLYTCGEFDECTPETTKYYHRNTPGSKMAVFKGASHEHHLEKQNQYLAVLSEFLSRTDLRKG